MPGSSPPTAVQGELEREIIASLNKFAQPRGLGDVERISALINVSAMTLFHLCDVRTVRRSTDQFTDALHHQVMRLMAEAAKAALHEEEPQ